MASTALARLRSSVAECLAAPREARSARRRAGFVDAVLPKGGVGAELGVFKGRFSHVLLEGSKARRLHLVDPWYLLTPRWHWGIGDRSTVGAVRRILRRWHAEIEAGRVVVHIGDDREVLASLDDHSLDWVYVDSSHDYQHTVEELALLRHKVRPGGIIAGDDWQPDPSHPHHGVHLAVMELVSSGSCEVVYADAGDQQWAIRLPDEGSDPSG